MDPHVLCACVAAVAGREESLDSDVCCASCHGGLKTRADKEVSWLWLTLSSLALPQSTYLVPRLSQAPPSRWWWWWWWRQCQWQVSD